MDNRVLAKIARTHGPKLLEQALDRLVPGTPAAGRAANLKAKKPSIGRRIANAALLRVATGSVPGAILVSGGLIAKALHDRRKARQTLRLNAPRKAGK